ncbi:hypothetical protein GOBAR_AA37196 [Gossypium barbadense]|uniref:RNase H type-1 domain-containing protein n=1 Tax=Gossypium barbadense TaxID=3634 RepID=A0A2P5VXF3_GOSBA|nr:hypothetical protein GOBAR_AA37196 [Gossypium barbadense]
MVRAPYLMDSFMAKAVAGVAAFRFAADLSLQRILVEGDALSIIHKLDSTELDVVSVLIRMLTGLRITPIFAEHDDKGKAARLCCSSRGGGFWKCCKQMHRACVRKINDQSTRVWVSQLVLQTGTSFFNPLETV